MNTSVPIETVMDISSVSGQIHRWLVQYELGALSHGAIENIGSEWSRRFFADYRRLFRDVKAIDVDALNFLPPLQAVLLYRIAHAIYKNGSTEFRKDALRLSVLGRKLSGAEIYFSAEIGEGFVLQHGVGTVIGARSVLGSDCTVYQGVTFGEKTIGSPRPVIGNRVLVYPGALILGGVCVGDNVVIGAQSLVTSDVESYSVAAGAPAKVVRKLKDPVHIDHFIDVW